MLSVTVIDNGRIVHASWPGGAYVDLAFGPDRRGSEVINVWDHHTGSLPARYQEGTTQDIRDTLKLEVVAWIASNEEEGWSDWYEDYLRNAR